MVFMARLSFNQWYACSGGRHLADHVFFQSEPSAHSVIHILARVTSRSTIFRCTPSQFVHLLELGIFAIFHHFPFRLPVNHYSLFICSRWRFHPPTFAEDLLSTLYSVAFTIKIRHLWWPKIMPNNVDSIIANEALQQTSAPPCSSRLFVWFFQHPGNSLLQHALL